jgi:hypothetical protein
MVSNGRFDLVQIANGEASVALYAHDVGPADQPVPCWSYVSEGLAAFGQREIMFTLRRAPGEALPPGDGIGLLESVARLAKGGKLVDPGGLTEFGPRGFLGNASLRGLVYAPAKPTADVRVPPDALAAVALFGDELEAVKRYGATRVLARLGRATTFFPFPPWSERARQPVAGALASVLEPVGGLTLPDASVSIEGDTIFVRLLPTCAPLLAKAFEALPDDRPIALHVGLAPGASACLVWSPGQTAPEAISMPGADGSRIGACYLGLVPQPNADEVRLFEDGVMALVTDKPWASLRAALASGKPFRLARGGGHYDLVVEWIATEYASPFGGRHVAPGGFHAYHPAGPPKPPSAGPVGEVQIVLLTSEQGLRAATDSATLGEYIKSIEAGVCDVVGRMPASPGADLVVEVALTPDLPPAFSYGMRSLGPESTLGELLPPRLERVPAPDVRGEVRFQVLFALWGGTGKPLVGGDAPPGEG